MSDIKMSDVFEIGKSMSFASHWSDKKCKYAYIAINAYDHNQELIAKQSVTIKQQAALIENANSRAARSKLDEQNHWMPICAKQAEQIELLCDKADKLTSEIAKHSYRDDRDNLVIGIEYIEFECDELDEALAATKEG